MLETLRVMNFQDGDPFSPPTCTRGQFTDNHPLPLCYSVQHHVGQQTVVQQIGSRLRADKVAVSRRAVKVYVQVRAGHRPASRVADLPADFHWTTQRHRVSSFRTISPRYRRWPLYVRFHVRTCAPLHTDRGI